ncbi:MAG: alpha/beta hydrolase [Sandaracinaceae bacterium]
MGRTRSVEWALSLAATGLLACGGVAAPDAGPSGSPASSGDDREAGEDEGGEAEGTCTADRAGQVVTLTTADGVRLQADLYVEGTAGGPAAALFHMVPPSNDRTNYGRAFIDALLGQGLSVLNVDRRGAGASEGVAVDAYRGPKGKLDVRAAVELLRGHPCGFGRLGLVGASNGTTSVLDYTVDAAERGAPGPDGLVFLTGGSYTESQNVLRDARTALAPVPLLFVYSTAEREWSASFEDGAPAAWRFLEVPNGAHGTRMFEAVPDSVDDVAAFLGERLP